MGDWVAAGSLNDLWDGEMVGVELNAVPVVLCLVDGVVFAYEDRCPHLANPLSAGRLHEYALICAAHEWAFDVRSGHGINPVEARLRGFPVRLDGETILVDVPPAGS